MIAAPHLLPPTHRISYTHIHKGAAKLMLMWLLGCTCAALTLSSIEQMDGVVRGWSEFPSSNNSPRQTACIIVQKYMSSHARACKAMFIYPIWTHIGLLHILLLVC